MPIDAFIIGREMQSGHGSSTVTHQCLNGIFAEVDQKSYPNSIFSGINGTGRGLSRNETGRLRARRQNDIFILMAEWDLPSLRLARGHPVLVGGDVFADGVEEIVAAHVAEELEVLTQGGHGSFEAGM